MVRGGKQLLNTQKGAHSQEELGGKLLAAVREDEGWRPVREYPIVAEGSSY